MANCPDQFAICYLLFAKNGSPMLSQTREMQLPKFELNSQAGKFCPAKFALQLLVFSS
jgi:hypothetical protein